MLLPAQRTLDVSVRPVSLWLYRWGFSLDLSGDQIAPLRRLYLPTGVHSLCCGSGSMLLASQWGRGGSTLARQGCPDRTMTYLYACYAIAFLSGRIIGPNFLAEVGVLCFRGGGRGCGGLVTRFRWPMKGHRRRVALCLQPVNVVAVYCFRHAIRKAIVTLIPRR